MNPSIDRASTEILLGELKGQIVGIAESQRRLESGLIEHVKAQEIVRQVVDQRIVSLENERAVRKGSWRILAVIAGAAGAAGGFLHKLGQEWFK